MRRVARETGGGVERGRDLGVWTVGCEREVTSTFLGADVRRERRMDIATPGGPGIGVRGGCEQRVGEANPPGADGDELGVDGRTERCRAVAARDGADQRQRRVSERSGGEQSGPVSAGTAVTLATTRSWSDSGTRTGAPVG